MSIGIHLHVTATAAYSQQAASMMFLNDRICVLRVFLILFQHWHTGEHIQKMAISGKHLGQQLKIESSARDLTIAIRYYMQQVSTKTSTRTTSVLARERRQASSMQILWDTRSPQGAQPPRHNKVNIASIRITLMPLTPILRYL